MVYQGYTKDSVAYFAGIGKRCRVTQSPADFYMKILAVDYPKEAEDEKAIQYYKKSYE
jgi:hypothetical protein